MDTKKIIVIAVAAVIVFGGAYYFSMMYYPAPANQNRTNTTETGNSVSITNFSFNPSILTVKAGTTVTWTNNDAVTHSIKSGVFNSGNLSKGQTFQFKFEETGRYDYSCAIHPSMTGKIIVE